MNEQFKWNANAGFRGWGGAPAERPGRAARTALGHRRRRGAREGRGEWFSHENTWSFCRLPIESIQYDRCLVEVFVFLEMGGKRENLDIRIVQSERNHVF